MQEKVTIFIFSLCSSLLNKQSYALFSNNHVDYVRVYFVNVTQSPDVKRIC